MTDWIIISEDDLVDPRRSGGRIRAYCHIHGSDHQRSLSIDETRGFGDCHSCGAHVLVREINPEAAENIERRGGQTHFIKDPKYLASARSKVGSLRLEQWKIQELDLLRSAHEHLVKALWGDRARHYIYDRNLRCPAAVDHGVGYLKDGDYRGKSFSRNRWADRIIFPVESPNGLHFTGRSLKFWEPGMDEKTHRNILEAHKIDPYIKTYSGGWFNYKALPSNASVFCEGPFDALALIEAGVPHAVAVVGTAINPDWMPKGMGKITIAFDGDESGREKSEKARDALYLRGYDVELCEIPDDGQGKDWSERYRLHGKDGLYPLLADYTCTFCHAQLAAEDTHFGPDDQPYCMEHKGYGEQATPGHADLLDRHVENLQREQREAYLQACATGRLRKG